MVLRLKRKLLLISVILGAFYTTTIMTANAQMYITLDEYNTNEAPNVGGGYHEGFHYAIKYVPSHTCILKRVSFMTGGATGTFKIFLVEDEDGFPKTLDLTSVNYLAYASFIQGETIGWHGADFHQDVKVSRDTTYWIAFLAPSGSNAAIADYSPTSTDYESTNGLDFDGGWPYEIEWGPKFEAPWMVKFYTTDCGFDVGFPTQYISYMRAQDFVFGEHAYSLERNWWEYLEELEDLPEIIPKDLPILTGFDSDGDGYNDAVTVHFNVFSTDFRPTTVKVSAYLQNSVGELMDWVDEEYDLNHPSGIIYLGLNEIDVFNPETYYSASSNDYVDTEEGYYSVTLHIEDKCHQMEAEDSIGGVIHLYPPNFNPPTVIDVTPSSADGSFSVTFDAEGEKGEEVIDWDVIDSTNIESYDITRTNGNLEIVGQLEDPDTSGELIIQIDPPGTTATIKIDVASSTLHFAQSLIEEMEGQFINLQNLLQEELERGEELENAIAVFEEEVAGLQESLRSSNTINLVMAGVAVIAAIIAFFLYQRR